VIELENATSTVVTFYDNGK